MAGAQRVENVLVALVDTDGVVELEDRLHVTGRVLGDAIERERAVVGAPVEKRRRRAEARADRRLRHAKLHRADGALLPSLAHVVGHGFERAWAATLRGTRAVTKGLTATPDRLAMAADRSRRFLATKEGRARFRRALVDPHGLTAEEKAVTLFVGTTGLVLALVVAHLAVTLTVPWLATGWRTVLLLFGYAYVTSLGVAFPIEPVLLPAAMHIGKLAALAVVVLAKACAAWMVFFVGDSVNHKVHEKAKSSERWARFLDWSERFAERFGTAALVVFIATPGLPDFIALYLFGALHMRLRNFILGVALGSTILNGIILYGLGHAFGF